MFRHFCLVGVASLALTGCDMADKQEARYDDARNPYYKLAQQELDNGNPAKAAEDYEAALGAYPKLATAHYQLGHLYGDKLNDPIGEIFHFQQYLKLAPNGDKVDEVKALIDKQSQAFAASLPNSPVQSADDYARLQADNATLKKQVEDAGHTIAQLQSDLKAQAALNQHLTAVAASQPVSPTSPPAGVVTPGSTAPATGTVTPVASSGPLRALPIDATNTIAATPGTPPKALALDAPTTTNIPAAGVDPTQARSYKVEKGDSLWTIAHKMYPGGNTKENVEKIQEANKDVLGAKPLKIGQVLVIP